MERRKSTRLYFNDGERSGVKGYFIKMYSTIGNSGSLINYLKKDESEQKLKMKIRFYRVR